MVLISFEMNGAVFFVREDGNDGASGISRAGAWRTIERVNRAKLGPGDKVLFEAGRKFSGNLRLTAEDSGSAESPVVIGSTEGGRAALLAGLGTGISVASAENLRLENLEILGAGAATNGGYGVRCDNLGTNGQRLGNLTIDRVEVSGFGVHGILISGVQAGFEHVRVTGCVIHDNLRGGMEIAGRLPYDSPLYAHADVVVRDCETFHNPGDPNFARNHSGSGIVLYQVDGGSMVRCASWDNGFMGDNRAGGGVGLWVCASRRVVIQECESFANKTRGMDGGGFDIDGGCEECALQYNYSHDNDGPGLMVYTYPYASHRDHGNVVRFNISENDSRRSRTYAGLWVRADGRTMDGLEVYNNTVVTGGWSDQAAFVHGDGVQGGFRNNIFVARGGGQALRVTEPRPALRFEGNLYWRDGGSFSVEWGGERITTLESWRPGTSQELISGKTTGVFADPGLDARRAGREPFMRVGLGESLPFRPGLTSPVLKGGVELLVDCGIDPGSRDLAGQRLEPKNRLQGAALPARWP